MLDHRSPAEAQRLTADGHYREGLVHRTRQRHADALESFRKALLLDPNHRPSLLAMAALLGDLGRWRDSTRVYERAHHCYPADARIAELLALSRSGRRPASFVEPGGSLRIDHSWLRRRGTIVGFLIFGLVVYTYLTVGLMTHFIVGIAAAGVAAALLSGGGMLLFPRHRALALRAILRGMAYGLGVTVLVAVASLVIALVIAARDGGTTDLHPDPSAIERDAPPL